MSDQRSAILPESTSVCEKEGSVQPQDGDPRGLRPRPRAAAGPVQPSSPSGRIGSIRETPAMQGHCARHTLAVHSFRLYRGRLNGGKLPARGCVSPAPPHRTLPCLALPCSALPFLALLSPVRHTTTTDQLSSILFNSLIHVIQDEKL